MNFSKGLITKQVSAQIKIKAPSQEVWKVISKPGNLNYCHPFCMSNNVKKWGSVGAVDFIKYYNGICLKRIFTEWTEGKGYELIIGNGKEASAKVKWEIIPQNDFESLLIIRINMLPTIILKKYPTIFIAALSKLYIIPNMKQYVESVVSGFKYYIETGSDVKLNQFGYNRMFSVKQIRYNKY
jgi:hypothetical protein